MRKLIVAAAFAALIIPAEAQQGRPGPQTKPPAAGQTQPQPPAPQMPPIFPRRTAEEICFLGIVTGKSQIVVLFTNAEKAEGIDAKPVEVLSGEAPGAALDLAPHLGRVVMLTGAYDAQAGLTKAELVDVASPLLSFALKASLGGGDDQPPSPPAQRGPKGKR